MSDAKLTSYETQAKELEALGESIAELAAHLHAATYRLLELIRRFDEKEGWKGGFRSCAHWLAWRVGYDLVTAREKVRVAKTLADLPQISKAFAQGQISYAKARAMIRIANRENESNLLHIAQAGTAAHIEKLAYLKRRVSREDQLRQEEEKERERYLETHWDKQGMLVVSGRLPPEVGTLVEKALSQAQDILYKKNQSAEQPPGNDSAESSLRQPTRAMQKADALGVMAEAALGKGLSGAGSVADTRQVTIHVDADVLCDPGKDGLGHSAEGRSFSYESVRRLCCDAGLVPVVHDAKGEVLDVGRKTRKIPSALRRALNDRQPRCQFPGCECNRFLDTHHIEHWVDGGETSKDNLVLLCRVHHRAIHEGGFSMARTAGGELHFHQPTGKRLELVPSLSRIENDSAESLSRGNHEADAHPDATALSVWQGERMDYNWALSGLTD